MAVGIFMRCFFIQLPILEKSELLTLLLKNKLNKITITLNNNIKNQSLMTIFILFVYNIE